MHFITYTTLSLLALATSATATFAQVNNNCPIPIWITITNATQQPSQYAVPINGTYLQGRSGIGNAFGLSKTSAYFSPQTPKWTLGFTDSPQDGLLYWSVINADGDAFAGLAWRVSFSDPACPAMTAYDGGIVHTCAITANLTVTLC
ncbi:unnamed protein product [Aureobasidium uvarum]|uniref:Bys1 family protein n=1 Tax=Aureobasidium uvarum TaxID=2773716 RepID=A0A9N8KWK7_9PEZI|nr:unnamed protein product [Aureobasidium uvarum]